MNKHEAVRPRNTFLPYASHEAMPEIAPSCSCHAPRRWCRRRRRSPPLAPLLSHQGSSRLLHHARLLSHHARWSSVHTRLLSPHARWSSVHTRLRSRHAPAASHGPAAFRPHLPPLLRPDGVVQHHIIHGVPVTGCDAIVTHRNLHGGLLSTKLSA